VTARPLQLRTLLVLGRASNLPTVWSNVLAAWILGGGSVDLRLLLPMLGATLAYIGGMYLNDAFDAEFDREFRRERPIPSGAVSEKLVWRAGGAMLALGTLILAAGGWLSAAFSVGLAVSVVLYDWIHKQVTFSPVLMAACRLFLFLAVAAGGPDGVGGTVLWTAIALSGWIVGLSYVARRESRRGPVAWWPLVALALPWVLAALVNDGPWLPRSLAWSVVLGLWTAWCLRHTFGGGPRNIGRTVSGLLAGICLTDLLALVPEPGLALVFLALFALALLGQRFVPAT
jgi:4-hydroxybenzoate polyprenyltransferase